MNQSAAEMRKLIEYSDLVKDSSPDSCDVIDKTVSAIKSRLQAVNDARKVKVTELDRLKSQWYVFSRQKFNGYT